MSINNQQLISSFSEFGSAKNIDNPTLIRMLDDVLQSLITKKFGTADNFDIVINPTKGDLQIWRYREIVADDSPQVKEHDKISLSEAHKIEADFEIGEQVAEAINLRDFSRIDINQAINLLKQKIQDIEKTKLYEKFKKLEGEIISAEVYYITRTHIVLYDEKREEFTLPTQHIIPGETFRKGQHILAVLHKVQIHNSKVLLILSRTSPKFLERLLEREIPEIFDKLVIIKKIVRQPGIRAKVAVMSYDDRIDPVGACIGVKGIRIRNLMHQINNEQIDVISYTDNLETYISRALGLRPGMLNKVYTTNNTIIVDLQQDQIPLAIGNKGYNISLASQLLDKDIKVNDTSIHELAHTLPESIIQALKQSELTTAKMILSLSKEDLIQRTKLDPSAVETLYDTLQQQEL